MMRNVLPSGAVLGRHPFLRSAIPSVVLEGRRFPLTRVQDAARVERELNRPGVLGPPSGLPVISRAIPKFTPTLSTGGLGRKDLGGIKGMTLPRQAERPLTPFMRRQILVHRQLQGLPRIETRPEFRPLAKPEIAPPVEVIRGRTSRKIPSPEAREIQPVPSREFRQPVGGGFRAVAPRTFYQPFGFRSHVPPEFRVAPHPFFRHEPRATFGTRPFTRGLRGSSPSRKFSPSFRRR
jgi:hypothetical protein